MIQNIAFTKTKHFCVFLSLLFILSTSYATSQTQKIGNHSQKEHNHAKVKKAQASKVDKEQSTKVKKKGKKSKSNVNKKDDNPAIFLEYMASIIFQLIIWGIMQRTFWGLPWKESIWVILSHNIAICVEWYRGWGDLFVRSLDKSVAICIIMCLIKLLEYPLDTLYFKHYDEFNIILSVYLILSALFDLIYGLLSIYYSKLRVKLNAALANGIKKPKMAT